MPASETVLSKQEKTWILERRVTRLSDNKEVQIYPMGAERYLSSALLGKQKNSYDIHKEIDGKNVLVIPGHGNSSFLIAQKGAQSVTTYDKDPVTIAWMKAFKKYYHYRETDNDGDHPSASIGELFTALTEWYPPVVNLPRGKLLHLVFWMLHPNSLRRVYIHYMVELVQLALQTKSQDNYELDKEVQFYVGTLEKFSLAQGKKTFDTAFIPYLLGIKNGIETQQAIGHFIKQLIEIIPNGHIIVTPSSNIKDFYFFGKRYFVTTEYHNLYDIPELKTYFIENDKSWFRRQGLAIFGSH